MISQGFKKLYKRFKNLYEKQIDGLGLEIFRILFFSFLLGDVLFLLKHHHLIFDRIPFLEPYELGLWPALILWIVSLACIILGFKTRIALVANYIFCVVFIANVSTYEYHMYYVFVTVSVVCVFIPFGKRLSIDNWRNRISGIAHSTTTSAFNYFIIVFTGIGLTYFDSIFHKFNSQIWLNGLGVWLPSSIPHIVIRDFTPILNQKYLMLFLGYFTLCFEAAFIFIFWIKPFRTYLFLIGLGLHIGITLVYPIPYFGLGMSALYFLLVPVHFWKCIYHKIFPVEKTKPIVFTSSKAKVNLALAGVVILICMQTSFTYYSPIAGSIKKRLPYVFVIPDKIMAPISRPLQVTFGKFFGFHHHGVFVDGHFNDYDHNISLVHKSHTNQLLPISQESGMVGAYQSGPLWAKWGFRTNAPRVDSTRLVNGARDFSLQWMHDNHLPFHDQHFDLVLKRNAIPKGWTKNFLQDQLKAPWVKFGSFHWENNKLIVDSIDFKAIYAIND